MSDYIGEVNTFSDELIIYVDERANWVELQINSVDHYLEVSEAKELIKTLQEALNQLGDSK